MAHERTPPRWPARIERSPGRRTTGLPASVDDREHVARGEDQVLLAVVLDLGAAVLRVDDDVPDRDVQRAAVAGVVDPARADREALALLRLLLGGVRDDDAGGRGGLRLAGLNDDLVLERLDVRHLSTSPWGACFGYMIRTTAWGAPSSRVPERHVSAVHWHSTHESANASTPVPVDERFVSPPGSRRTAVVGSGRGEDRIK